MGSSEAVELVRAAREELVMRVLTELHEYRRLTLVPSKSEWLDHIRRQNSMPVDVEAVNNFLISVFTIMQAVPFETFSTFMKYRKLHVETTMAKPLADIDALFAKI